MNTHVASVGCGGPAWNTLEFLLRQAMRAADVIGVHLAILDCHSCSENRSQKPEGGSGRQGGLVCMEMERSRRYGPDTGASWVRPTPSCYDLLMLLEPVMC